MVKGHVIIFSRRRKRKRRKNKKENGGYFEKKREIPLPDHVIIFHEGKENGEKKKSTNRKRENNLKIQMSPPFVKDASYGSLWELRTHQIQSLQ